MSETLDTEFEATLQNNPGKGGWTCVLWPDSVESSAPAGW
jgi:hypothetical protein